MYGSEFSVSVKGFKRIECCGFHGLGLKHAFRGSSCDLARFFQDLPCRPEKKHTERFLAEGDRSLSSKCAYSRHFGKITLHIPTPTVSSEKLVSGNRGGGPTLHASRGLSKFLGGLLGSLRLQELEGLSSQWSGVHRLWS